MKWYERPTRVQPLLLLLVCAPFLLIQVSGLLDLFADSDLPNACRGCLQDVAFLPNGDGWATVTTGLTGSYSTQILHRQQGVWHWEPLPIGELDYVTNIAADAPDDAWALTNDYHQGVGGGDASGTTGMLHYQQGAWHRFSFASPYPLSSFTMLASNDGWAIEDKSEAQNYATTLMHFDGQTWQAVPMPGANGFASLAFISRQEGWAVGAAGHIAHYLNGQWHELPSPTSYNLLDVQMLSSTSGWAIGEDGETLYYEGTSWHEPPHFTLPHMTFGNVAMLSAHEGWATQRNQFHQSYILWHFTGTMWQETDFAKNDFFFSVATQNADEGWAVGQFLPTGGSKFAQGIIAHYAHGVWETMATPRLAEPFVIASARAVISLVFVATGLLALGLWLRSFWQPATSLLRKWWAREVFICFIAAAGSGLLDVAEPFFASTYHDELRITCLLISNGFGLLACVGFFGGARWEIRHQKKPQPVRPEAPIVQPTNDDSPS